MYDYVIVGAGSAGCVLATRLSEDPNISVLLLEAGGADTNQLIRIPAAWPALMRTEVDWDLSTGYEPQCNNRRVYLPRGKVLGGSSSTNGGIYIRGHRRDFDEWREAGCDGWGWDDLLPYFIRAEDNERGASDLHGVGGPMKVSDVRYRNANQQAFIDAALGHGLPPNEDFNGPMQEGVGWYQTNTRDGMRESAASAYLHPVINRPNLTVRTRVHALKILFDGTRAVGVAGTRLDEQLGFRAEREVIISAGAYGSPQLLMLSGIGRPDALVPLGIKPVAELPGVGVNLQDHTVCGLAFLAKNDDTLFGAFNEANLELLARGEGPLTGPGNQAGGFARTSPELDIPDVQLFCVPALFVDEGLVPPHTHGVSLAACVTKPVSTGYLALVSPDPTAKPLIMHNYYTEPIDLHTQIAAIRLCMQIAHSEPLTSRLGDPVLHPTTHSESAIAAHIRQHTQTSYHATSSCKMGTDGLAVVDLELRVRGVDALRVVDASIMPSVPRGNTGAATVAIAEKAADLIRGRTHTAATSSATTPGTGVPV